MPWQYLIEHALQVLLLATAFGILVFAFRRLVVDPAAIAKDLLETIFREFRTGPKTWPMHINRLSLVISGVAWILCLVFELGPAALRAATGQGAGGALALNSLVATIVFVFFGWFSPSFVAKVEREREGRERRQHLVSSPSGRKNRQKP